MLTGLAVTAAATAAGCYLGPAAARRLATLRLQRWCSRRRILVLTFDDGPGPDLTPAVLALLDRREAQATFFPLSRRAVRTPALLDVVREGGHEIGWHGHHHLDAWTTSPWRSMRDVHEGHRHLHRWLGSAPLFRPPYGKTHVGTHWAVRRCGGRMGWWTIDSGDTSPRPPAPAVVAETVARRNGGVVLMHDVDRGHDRHDRVIETATRLLDLARERGLHVRRLGDVLDEIRRTTVPDTEVCTA